MNNDQRIVEELSILRKEIDRLKRVEVPIMPVIPVVTEWQSWTPSSVVGWSTKDMTTRYCLVGNTCFFIVDVISGTSNNNQVLISAPLPKKGNAGGVNAMTMDNGVLLAVASRWWIDNANNIQAYTDMGSGTWTASGTKRVRIFGFYEVE